MIKKTSELIQKLKRKSRQQKTIPLEKLKTEIDRYCSVCQYQKTHHCHYCRFCPDRKIGWSPKEEK